MPDTTTIAPELAQLRSEAATLTRKLAAAEYKAAAALIREVFLTADGELLFAKDEDDDGQTRIVPLVLLDKHQRLAWFNGQDYRYISCDYPGNQQLRRPGKTLVKDLTTPQLESLTEHLTRGYEAATVAGYPYAEPITDPYYRYDVTVLSLDINAALNGTDHGYICKKCTGPSPMGIGYVADGYEAAAQSAKLTRCGCGYSRTEPLSPAGIKP